MKKTLKLMPEYQCYPLWLYDSDGTLIDNIIPESLQANKELMDALTSVQQQFDALYTNAPQTYSYVGFPDEKWRERQQNTRRTRQVKSLRSTVGISMPLTERIRSLLCH